MIEKHVYQCEVCGKEFAFEDECLDHELKCKTAGLEKSIIFADSSGNIITFPQEDWNTAIGHAYYIYIANQEAADKLEKLFYEYNYNFPANDVQEAVLYPALFVYEDNGMYWKSLQDVENEYNELLAVKDELQDCLLNKNIGE